jgi:asparagine synthase (glutamine-hydrolysing)
LFIARDRCGVKPVYWYHDGTWFLFGSEIKCILAVPEVKRAVCATALNEYFTFQNTLSEQTMFEGVRLLPPGHCLSVDMAHGGAVRQWQYWDYEFAEETLSGSPEELAEQVHGHFSRAVERQLLSDVPIGSYLSGGMDSGSIVALARRKLGRMHSFTCGFDLSSASGLELGFDERSNAEQMANLFKTEHYEMVLHAGDMEHIMPELIWHLEDLRVGQCYPNYYVARLAGKFVKVCLSGAGGDELFAGYPWRYFRGAQSTNKADYERNYFQFWQRLVPDGDKGELFAPEIASQLRGHSAFEVFTGVLGKFNRPVRTPEDFINASLYFELKTFLHGLLVVEDKVSMAHSLETRVPFLDNELVDLALKVPVSHKLRQFGELTTRVDENDVAKRPHFREKSDDGKIVLRQAMGKILPPEITGRVKQGLSAPDASWFRGESIDYINRFLRDKNARLHELVNPAYITRTLDEHCSGKINHRLLIWSFLSLEWWLRTFFENAGRQE